MIRHGDTEWSVSGAHTGRSDIPLTSEGEKKAIEVGRWLAGQRFALVLTSPLQRARRTCELAGFGGAAQIDPNLLEWDYGKYEGLTSDQIRATRPGWTIFGDGPLGGETLQQVAERARLVIERANTAEGNVALFAHGHILRILATCWLGVAAEDARLLALSAGGISTLGFEHETKVIVRWNLTDLDV